MRGSHLFRDPAVSFLGDEALYKGWVQGKVHPTSGEPLKIEQLECPPGSVIAMWTHAVHGVSARKEGRCASKQGSKVPSCLRYIPSIRHSSQIHSAFEN